MHRAAGRLLLTGGVLAAALALGGCGGDAPAAHRGYAVATGTASGHGNTAGLAGVLHGSVGADGTACFWVEVAPKPGSPAGRVAVLWPHGSRAYPHPLRVVDDGHVLGTAGRNVSLTGGFLPPEALPVTGCPDIDAAFG